ncbi:MAG TPA: hypothetical protein VHD86_08745, partial [Xanthobacteraceae bacterium]|nr:hypothetical protein [Xanthobacteraceae bacterium]
MEDKRSRSRGAIFCASEPCGTPFQERRHNRPSSEQFGRGETEALKIGYGARTNERTEKKKEAERRQTRVY